MFAHGRIGLLLSPGRVEGWSRRRRVWHGDWYGAATGAWIRSRAAIARRSNRRQRHTAGYFALAAQWCCPPRSRSRSSSRQRWNSGAQSCGRSHRSAPEWSACRRDRPLTDLLFWPATGLSLASSHGHGDGRERAFHRWRHCWLDLPSRSNERRLADAATKVTVGCWLIVVVPTLCGHRLDSGVGRGDRRRSLAAGIADGGVETVLARAAHRQGSPSCRGPGCSWRPSR